MMTLADATSLLEQTTDFLRNSPAPEAGITILDEWIGPLRQAPNTKPIADALAQLKTRLQADPVNDTDVRTSLGQIADLLSALSPETGSEGEMPSLLEGLAAALRESGETSITD
ncbi:hypothetical protein [Arsenicibacter rosenii]|uniref:Uncharacterized protein n=1 Tax=Arsenicibacter rosenii TaxID=1750698 RepID=A0A1S2VLW8_9BACT|nr:hypothetical protein [Arsenicibacter rosenii]OIN59739.1 hypothetical protein BLX24_07720 [Arsenicibacter rosenii]